MATDNKDHPNGHDRPIRVIDDTAANLEDMMAGHIIPGADPPKNEAQRGGFGNRDGKEGYGVDSSDGPSGVSVNEDADRTEPNKDNIRTDEEGRGT
ncbi:hypothetical protein [Sabulibacter ruber]|uniref:hypothetical protein n=1 Tax=Sabulibacter ruber TaxID=2811901 RepID=UPI001A96D06D|nr:hypothetical protein [Sabulibacter ruber]